MSQKRHVFRAKIATGERLARPGLGPPGPRSSARPSALPPQGGTEGRKVSESALQQVPARAPGTNDLPTNDVRPAESLVALTLDDSLKETLAAVAPEHVLTFVTDVEDLSRHLHIEPAGVAILDSAALTVPAAELTQRLRAQFPDLVLVVAGGPEDQAALSGQVAQGTIYRFLHKPVSAQRVKLFVDAAWRRHDVEHAATGTFAAVKLDASSSAPALSRRLLWTGAGTLAVVASGALAIAVHQALLHHGLAASSAAARQAAARASAASALSELLARADAALARGALSSPPAENAADLYRQVLQRDASNAHARQGLQRVADDLLTGAEQAFLGGRIEEAARLTDAARAIEPDNVRVTFLTAEIDKDRQAAGGPSTQSGAEPSARGGLRPSGAAGLGVRGQAATGSAGPGAAPLDLQAQVKSFLAQAQARARSGNLIEPAENNAKFFVDAAAALAPRDPAVRKAQRDLAARMLARARDAAQAGDLSGGERWAQAASDAGAPSEELAAVQRSLDSVRAAAQTAVTDRTLALFDQRLAQGKFLSPPHDNAQYYLAQLEAAAPTQPATVRARSVFASRLLDEARRATTYKDLGAAQEWLVEARAVGASGSDAAAVERAIAAARDAAGVRPESMLEKVHNVQPVYPPVAEQLGRGGFVEMQFTVRTDGSVGDIAVTHAQPPGMFDSAAVQAVRQWRYKPVQRDGHPVEQRVSLRVVFKP